MSFRLGLGSGFGLGGGSRVAAALQYLFNGTKVDTIGPMGEAGAGVGIASDGYAALGFAALSGHSDPSSDNYGNYQYLDGSIMCWVPVFFYKVGTGSNGLAVNVVDIKGAETYSTTAEANASGYALHRAFIDGGAEKVGFFIDKYMASKNALGAGFVASSIAGGLPISMHPDHNPIADLTACSANAYYEAINAAHARDGVDGAVNASSRFHVSSRFQWAAVALLSLAHGQAATSTTYCAWYDAGGTTNYPKGCNDDALGDTNDAEVAYVSDGYSNSAKTGSGTPFAKTTHNGQACGIADVNGLMYDLNLGITCVASSVSITAASQANPCQITAAGHGLSTGDPVMITDVGGMTEINDKIFTITAIDADNFTLDGVDSSAFTAYTSGGSATVGTFYAAKQATAMKEFTDGNSAATDHWGATGVAAMMDAFEPAFEIAYPNNGFSQRMGDGAGQVLSEATTGGDWLLTGLGLPKDADGLSAAGTNLFGTDRLFQNIQNELFLRSSLNWLFGSLAGVWGLHLDHPRTNSNTSVGFRAACYLGG